MKKCRSVIKKTLVIIFATYSCHASAMATFGSFFKPSDPKQTSNKQISISNHPNTIPTKNTISDTEAINQIKIRLGLIDIIERRKDSFTYKPSSEMLREDFMERLQEKYISPYKQKLAKIIYGYPNQENLIQKNDWQNQVVHLDEPLSSALGQEEMSFQRKTVRSTFLDLQNIKKKIREYLSPQEKEEEEEEEEEKENPYPDINLKLPPAWMEYAGHQYFLQQLKNLNLLNNENEEEEEEEGEQKKQSIINQKPTVENIQNFVSHVKKQFIPKEQYDLKRLEIKSLKNEHRNDMQRIHQAMLFWNTYKNSDSFSEPPKQKRTIEQYTRCIFTAILPACKKQTISNQEQFLQNAIHIEGLSDLVGRPLIKPDRTKPKNRSRQSCICMNDEDE